MSFLDALLNRNPPPTVAPKPDPRALFNPIAVDTVVAQLFTMADPDATLRKLGIRRYDLRALWTDDEISAAMDTRREAVIATPWRLEPGTGRSVSWIWDTIEPHIPDLLRNSMQALAYGYSVQEVIYKQPDNGRIGIDRIDDKPFEWFGFDGERRLRYQPPWSGELLDVSLEFPHKFILTQHQATYRNPYGEALFSRLYWPWFFRVNGWKFWAKCLERTGTPFLKGTAPPGLSIDGQGNMVDNVDLLSDALASAVQNATIALPEGWQVEFLQATQTGASYEQFEAACLKRIQRLILGQTLTSDTGQNGGGSYALGQVHNEVRMDRRNADIRLVTQAVQALVDSLWTLNGFNGSPPAFVMEDGQGLEAERAARDATLVNAGICKLTDKYLLRVYDFETGDIEVPENTVPDSMDQLTAEQGQPPAPAPANFSAMTFAPAKGDQLPDQTAIDDGIEALATADTQNQAMAEAMLKPVVDLIQNASTYHEVMVKLAEQFPDMDTAKLEDRLARALFAADAWGMINSGKS